MKQATAGRRGMGWQIAAPKGWELPAWTQRGPANPGRAGHVFRQVRLGYPNAKRLSTATRSGQSPELTDSGVSFQLAMRGVGGVSSLPGRSIASRTIRPHLPQQSVSN